MVLPLHVGAYKLKRKSGSDVQVGEGGYTWCIRKLWWTNYPGRQEFAPSPGQDVLKEYFY